MYFKSIEIENTGPIEKLKIEFPFENEAPKPLIIVGENGTGKSILLSHLVNSIIVGKTYHYDDAEIEEGRVFKYRSPNYVMAGKHYSYSAIKFTSGIEVSETQLHCRKSDFIANFGYTPENNLWQQIPHDEASFFSDTFSNFPQVAKDFYQKFCCLYFPVNRFEEPAWLNIDNLKSKTNYTELKRVSRYSNRSIIATSPMRKNQDWILDIILDFQTHEAVYFPFQPNGQDVAALKIFAGHRGNSTNIYEAILRVLSVILRKGGNYRLGIGPRKNRQISVMRNDINLIPNLFQLSSGEMQLLNLFLSIVRDYDLSSGEINTLSDVKGIVIIDEIDSNLHTVHQKEVLPELISSFPNVQFIITTHSPLFLLGMEEKFGADNFTILNMPDGNQLVSSDFSEFKNAYDAFRETSLHRDEIRNELEKLAIPIVFLEGDYDVRYVKKAAKVLGKENILDKIKLENGDGFGNLNKIWKSYDNPLAETLTNKVVLIYDCDIKKNEEENGKIFKWTIPSDDRNPIKIGIENLFPTSTIEKVEAANERFIDVIEGFSKKIRGEKSRSQQEKSVNKDEKGNLCSWLCENGIADDFINFTIIFEKIEEILNR